MDSMNELLEQLKNLVVLSVVSCPETPIKVSGIGTAAAYSTGEVMGSITVIDVPRKGIIHSATFWDMDDEGLQYDLEIFDHNITQVADNNAWSPSDLDMVHFITELAFAGFDDQINSQTSELNNIGKAYIAPEGKFYIQTVVRGAHNIAVGAEPRFQLQIIDLERKS